MNKTVGKSIHIRFHPFEYDKRKHTVEKADTEGKKRRYLCGISSGLNPDAHGERLTETCLNNFMEQMNSGDILLYPDIHGIKTSDDIGILTKAEILPSGDWYTEYRLYDEHDGIGQGKLEKIDTLWKMINGLPPYKKPKQFGFSIEGIIPDEAVVYSSDGQIDREVIDAIDLDGVVLVSRPAYTDSVATAVEKALGKTTPQRKESLRSALRDSVEREETSNEYYRLKWQYQDALEETITKVMTKNNNNKREELEELLEEYKELMVNLVLQSEKLFAKEQEQEEEVIDSGEAYSAVTKSESPKLALFKSLHKEMTNLVNSMEKRNGENKTK